MEDKSSPSKREMFVVVCVVFFAQLFLFFLDTNVRFFYGDSLQYLKTADIGYIPNDRSWLYGYLVRFITMPFSDWGAEVLIFVQCMALGVIAVSIYFIMRYFFRCGVILGSIACIFILSDPVNFLYQRMVMAELFSMMFFILSILMGLLTLKKMRFRYFLLFNVFGLLGIAMRTAFLIPNLFLSAFLILAILFKYLMNFDVKKTKRELFLPLSCIFVVFLAHSGLKFVNSKMMNNYSRSINYKIIHPPAYQYSDGWFMFAAWGHLIEPRHCADEKFAFFLKDEATEKVKNIRGRLRSMWSEVGIRARVNDYYGVVRGNALAKTTAMRAMMERPLLAFYNIRTCMRAYYNFELRLGAVKEDLNLSNYPHLVSAEEVERSERILGLSNFRDFISKETLAMNYFVGSFSHNRIYIVVLFSLSILFFLTRGTFCYKGILYGSVIFYIVGLSFYAGNEGLRLLLPINPLVYALFLLFFVRKKKTKK